MGNRENGEIEKWGHRGTLAKWINGGKLGKWGKGKRKWEIREIRQMGN